MFKHKRIPSELYNAYSELEYTGDVSLLEKDILQVVERYSDYMKSLLMQLSTFHYDLILAKEPFSDSVIPIRNEKEFKVFQRVVKSSLSRRVCFETEIIWYAFGTTGTLNSSVLDAINFEDIISLMREKASC